MSHLKFSCNADRYEAHERDAMRRAVRNGQPPRGCSVDADTLEVFAADGRIVGYVADGDEPEDVATLSGGEAAELAKLRKWAAERADLERLRALAARVAAGPGTAPSDPDDTL